VTFGLFNGNDVCAANRCSAFSAVAELLVLLHNRPNICRPTTELLICCIAGEKKYVLEGQSLALECQAMLYHTVIWRYYSPHNNEIHIVYRRGRIYNKDRQRFQIKQPEKDAFDLVVSGVRASDAGIYRCRESSGHQGATGAELIVTGEFNCTEEQISGNTI